MPSYSRWATDIVRRGLKPSLRLASCWRVLVVNGAAGDRFCWRTRDLADHGPRRPERVGVRLGAASSVTSSASPSMRTRSAGNVDRQPSAAAPGGSSTRAAMNAGDLSLALHDEAHRDRLHAAGGQAAADLAGQQRAERVAHEPVDDAPRLLCVDEVHVDVPGVREGLPDGGLGDLRERHPALLGDCGMSAASATCHAMASPSRSRSVAR